MKKLFLLAASLVAAFGQTNAPIIQLQNNGTNLGTVAAGPVKFNAASGVTASWNASSHTYTLTSLGGANLGVNIAGPATTSGAIDITSLNLSTPALLNSLMVQCYTGTGISSGVVTGNLTPLSCSVTSRSSSAVTVTFSSSSNVLVVLNSNGGPGTAGTNGTNGAGYAATSTTSLATGTGSKTFTTQSGLAYSAGARVRATSAGTSEYMEGVVTSYSGASLVVSMDRNSGTGTHSDWNLNVTGDAGANGSSGTNGAGYTATSTTSLATGTGSKTFTTQSGLAYTAGARIRATSAATGDYMEGVVSSYSGTSLVVTMDRNTGTGTHTDWNINLAGDIGDPNAAYTFSSSTSVTITHNRNTLNPVVTCFDASNNALDYHKLTITSVNVVTVLFKQAATGKCVVNTSGGTGSGSGGTGNVTTSVVLTTGLPAVGNGTTDLGVGTRQGNTTKYVSYAGTSPASGDCAQFDVNGNLTTAGAACGTGGGGGGTVHTGTGLTGDGSIATPVAVDQTVVPTRISAAGTLTFASIAQSACDEKTLALTGAVAGDEVFLGAPATVDQGFVWAAYVSAANTVTVRMCKITTGTVTPAALAWRATIVKSF